MTIADRVRDAPPVRPGRIRMGWSPGGFELVADDRVAWSRTLSKAVIAAGLPVWLVQAELRRRQLQRQHERYAGPGQLYWNTVGAPAMWGVTLERLSPPATPLVDDFRRLIDDAQLRRRYLGPSGRLVVMDDFYADPGAVRAQALAAEMTPFETSWFNDVSSTHGPTPASEEARARLGRAIGVPLAYDAFYSDCAGLSHGWNGAFHAKFFEDALSPQSCDIHNHANLGEQGWSGLVHLDPEVPADAGTTLWISRGDRTCAQSRWTYDARPRRFELLVHVPARFNRLVLFSAPLLHRGEAGYGWDRPTARLFQTFFFVES